MSFGQPSLEVVESTLKKQTRARTAFKVGSVYKRRSAVIREQWLLRSVQARWKLSIYDFGHVTFSSPYRRKLMSLYRLEGQKITKIRIDPQTAATEIDFDLGGKLELRRRDPLQEYTIWDLKCANGRWFLANANATYYYGILSEADDAASWKQLPREI